ncbi:MAG: MFS transporter [Thermodesulfobacteriota bacterium]
MTSVFFAANTLFYFCHWMVFAFLPLLLKEYGLTDGRIGIIIGTFSMASMLLMLPMGVFSDYFSPKKTVIAGTCCLSLYFFFLLLSRNFYWLLLSVAIGGAGASALFIVLSSLYLKVITRNSLSRQVALYHVGGYLGYAFGPLIGGLITSYYPPKSLIATAWACSLALIALTLFLRDSAPIRFSFEEYRADLKKPGRLLLILGIFVLATHFGVEQTSFTLLMKGKLGFAPRNIGYMFAGIGLWMAFLVPFVGYFMDRKQRIILFLFAGLVMSGAFQFLTGKAWSFGSLLLTRIFHTTGDAIAILGIGVLTALYFPGARLGGNSGLLYVVRTAAMFSGAVAAGLINTRWGYSSSFMANGLFVLAFTAILAISFRRCFSSSPAGQSQ